MRDLGRSRLSVLLAVGALWAPLPQEGRLDEGSSPGGQDSAEDPEITPQLVDCTGSLFANDPSFARQLLPALEHWCRGLAASVRGPRPESASGIAVGDVNGDGLEDFFLCQPGGLPNRLYLNAGDGTVRPGPEPSDAGVLDSTRTALLIDWDGDGDRDLVALIGEEVVLFANDGTGRFGWKALYSAPEAGMLYATDYGLDGDLDLLVVGIENHRMLLENRGDWTGASEEDAEITALLASHLLERTGASLLADLDLDGERDALVPGEHLPADVLAAARIDWDLDGDLDLLVTTRSGPRVRLLRNEQPSLGRFVAFRLEGVTSNRDAIGAEIVVLFENGKSIDCTLWAGEYRFSQSSSWVHFGLGTEEAIDRVLVHWPGDASETFAGIEIGRRYVLRQGTARAERWDPPRQESRLEPSPGVPPPLSDRARVVLPVPLPMPRLAIESPGGETTDTYGIQPGREPTPTGRPVLLVLWTTESAPCLEHLGELAVRADDFEQRGIALVALGADRGAKRALATSTLEELGWPLPAAFAPRETVMLLDVLQGFLMGRETSPPLPASFLVDREGRLVAMYFGLAAPDTLLADVALTELSPPERIVAASPFPGTWGHPPKPASLRELELVCAERGLTDTARELRLGNADPQEDTRARLLHGFGLRAGEQGRFEDAVAYFQAALEEDPLFVEAWCDLGVALHRGGRVESAVDAYLQALLVDPDHAQTRLNLGLAHVALGNRAPAEEQLRYLREARFPEAAILARAIATLPDDDD